MQNQVSSTRKSLSFKNPFKGYKYLGYKNDSTAVQAYPMAAKFEEDVHRAVQHIMHETVDSEEL